MRTVAYLKENTPFDEFFSDGVIPIISIFPIIPREAGSPECYVVNANELTEPQINGLAVKVLEYWPTECLSLDEAIAYVRKGLPLNTEWFSGWSTSDPGIFFSLMPDYSQSDVDIARGWDEDWEDSENWVLEWGDEDDR
jgi:hypothetical protein